MIDLIIIDDDWTIYHMAQIQEIYDDRLADGSVDHWNYTQQVLA